MILPVIKGHVEHSSILAQGVVYGIFVGEDEVTQAAKQ